MKDYSILIIDDEEPQRNVLSGYLQKKGLKVYSASSGNEGIDITKNNLVDIDLSDYSK